MRKIFLLCSLLLSALLYAGIAYAQTAVTMTIPANVSQLLAFNQWCAFYINIAPATQNSAQQVQCVDTVVQRAVQSFGVASAAATIVAPTFNPN